MKKIYSLLLCVSLLLINQGISAKDIYLSATGDNKNDGLTAATAVKTLLRVNEIVASEDVIHVKGLIKISEETDFATKIEDGTQDPPVSNGIILYHRGYYFRSTEKMSGEKWAGVTFLGGDGTTDGFSGDKQAALFQFDGALLVTFKNILFTNARTHRGANNAQYGSDASVFWANGAELVFENCYFTGNDITRDADNPMQAKSGFGERGCISMCNGKYTFKGCIFEENTAQEGAALYIGAGEILIEDCHFRYNETDIINGSTGGAIYTWCNGDNKDYLGMNLNIRRCFFENNTAKKGGAIAIQDKVHYSPVNINIDIDRCVFVGNIAGENQGGAIFYNNFNDAAKSLDNITISNSLFFGNQAAESGGALCVWNTQAPAGKHSELKLVNNTFTYNFSGGGPTNGGGIGFMRGYDENNHLPNNMIKTIYNTIIDGNWTTGGEEGMYFADLGLYYTPLDAEPGGDDMFDIQNCFIGRSVNLLIGRDNIPTDINKIDYYEGLDYDGGVTAGFVYPDYYGPDPEFYAVPLEEDAEARTYGNAKFLIGEDDLSGKPREIVDGKCAIGASDVTSDELDEHKTWGSSGIAAVATGSPIKLFQQNNMLVCLTNTQETTAMALYNLTGNKILEGKNYISLRRVGSGIYIAKVQIGAAIYTQKVVIK